jgi:hypothetical protein
MEKKIEEIKIHCTETMKREIQDAAMDDDRRVSDWITHTIGLALKLKKSGVIMTSCSGCEKGRIGHD